MESNEKILANIKLLDNNEELSWEEISNNPNTPKQGLIFFKNKRSTNRTIFQPLVQSNISSARDVNGYYEVEISAIVALCCQSDEVNFYVAQAYTTNNQSIFCIVSDEARTNARYFGTYQVNFTAKLKGKLNVPQEIIVYQYDKDPRLSRGTVTTVDESA